MHFRVQHTTNYRYPGTVELSPHVMRLCPRGDGFRLSRFEIQIHPTPHALVDQLDAEGNRTHLAWFQNTTDHLTIVTNFEGRATRANPFHYVVTEPTAQRLPLRYRDHAAALRPYQQPTSRSGPVAALARLLARAAGGDTLPYLTHAMQAMSPFQKDMREDGPPLAPAETLAGRGGACRDLAVLMVELCRLQGLAARFVSGYWSGTGSVERRYLHAWAEVYLPGAGWRGYDPASGLAVADEHVALAAALNPADAFPVQGWYAGSHVAPAMDWKIRIEVKPT